MNLRLAWACVFALLSVASLARAQGAHAHHEPATRTQAAAPSAPSASRAAEVQAAFEAANTRMHKDMAVSFTGDADKDFLAGMIPHHQGAIEMAEVVLKYGKDPKVKKLAQDIIRAQKKEIRTMQAWRQAMP